MYLRHHKILAGFINRTFNPRDPLPKIKKALKRGCPGCEIFVAEAPIPLGCWGGKGREFGSEDVSSFAAPENAALQWIQTMLVPPGGSEGLEGSCKPLQCFLCYIKAISYMCLPISRGWQGFTDFLPFLWHPDVFLLTLPSLLVFLLQVKGFPLGLSWELLLPLPGSPILQISASCPEGLCCWKSHFYNPTPQLHSSSLG